MTNELKYILRRFEQEKIPVIAVHEGDELFETEIEISNRVHVVVSENTAQVVHEGTDRFIFTERRQNIDQPENMNGLIEDIKAALEIVKQRESKNGSQD